MSIHHHKRGMRRRGAALVEWSVLVGGVLLVVVFAINTLGSSMTGYLNATAANMGSDGSQGNGNSGGDNDSGNDSGNDAGNDDSDDSNSSGGGGNKGGGRKWWGW